MVFLGRSRVLPRGWRPKRHVKRVFFVARAAVPLTQAGRLEVSREEDGGEADEGRHAGGILPIPLAVLGEDVDFGGLEADAGIDLDHAAGPVGRARVGRCAGARDAHRRLQQPSKISRFTLLTLFHPFSQHQERTEEDQRPPQQADLLSAHLCSI